jgi:site-specific recombinase XerD
MLVNGVLMKLAVDKCLKTFTGKKKTLTEYVDEYLIGEGLSSKTISVYRYGLRKLLNAAGDTAEVDEDTLASAARRCLKTCKDRGLSKYTQHQIRRTIGTFFEWLVRERKLKYNPIHRVRKIRLPKNRKPPYLPNAQKHKLLKAALESRNPQRDYAFFCLAFDTGLRREEYVNLNIEDIDLRLGVVAVRDGKGGKDREVPIGKVARYTLGNYLEGRKSGPVFLTEDGQQLQGEGLYRMVKRTARRARVNKRVWVHLCRHTFGQDYLEVGDARALQQIFGHSNLSAIEPYTGDTIEDLVRKHRKASPVDRLLGKGNRRLL